MTLAGRPLTRVWHRHREELEKERRFLFFERPALFWQELRPIPGEMIDVVVGRHESRMLFFNRNADCKRLAALRIF